jgi:hypothetical protein
MVASLEAAEEAQATADAAPTSDLGWLAQRTASIPTATSRHLSMSLLKQASLQRGEAPLRWSSTGRDSIGRGVHADPQLTPSELSDVDSLDLAFSEGGLGGGDWNELH